MIIKSVILGIIQGITEFLPVSSSGHLVIFQKLFGFKTGQLTLSVFLHFGTLIPVLIIFWSDIKEILLFKRNQRYFILLIIVGIIPTGLMGVFFEDYFDSLYSSVNITGIMLIITGLILYLTEVISKAQKEIEEFKFYNSIIVGIAQGLAIIPGISRSGSTIGASLIQGLKREEAARFSFIISIPVIAGAGLLEFVDVYKTGLQGNNWIAITAGVIAAAISGFLAIKYLLKVLKRGRLHIFSYYCWIIGVLVLLAGLL